MHVDPCIISNILYKVLFPNGRRKAADSTTLASLRPKDLVFGVPNESRAKPSQTATGINVLGYRSNS